MRSSCQPFFTDSMLPVKSVSKVTPNSIALVRKLLISTANVAGSSLMFSKRDSNEVSLFVTSEIPPDKVVAESFKLFSAVLLSSTAFFVSSVALVNIRKPMTAPAIAVEIAKIIGLVRAKVIPATRIVAIKPATAPTIPRTRIVAPPNAAPIATAWIVNRTTPLLAASIKIVVTSPII